MRFDPRLDVLADRVGPVAPLRAVIVGRDRAEVAGAVGSSQAVASSLLAHLPGAIVRAPVGELRDLFADPRSLAVDAAQVDRSARSRRIASRR